MAASGRESQATGHTLDNHLLGMDPGHAHDGDADHDHDHFAQAGLLQPGMPDRVSLTSIGIDIGSSGTQIAFSRLHMQRVSEGWASRYATGTREVLFRSPITFTPYAEDGRIAARGVLAAVDAAFDAAGLNPDQIDTGVILLTGEALRRENAEPLARVLADRCGDVVSAAAGHHLEAVLAAFGSGAAQLSHDNRARLLNVDIGGGSTKLAVVENGRITATSALAIGGRLIAVDADGVIARLEPAAERVGALCGARPVRGARPAADLLVRIARAMADIVVGEILQPGSCPVDLGLTEPLPPGLTFDGIVVSGGVGEYVYGRTTDDFGDLGRLLGEALGRALANGALPWPLLPAKECIRATVVGASEYALQLSGRTGFMTSPRVLPKRALMVIAPPLDLADEPDAAEIARRITAHRRALGVGLDDDVALAIRWRGAPAHARLHALADGISRGFADRLGDDLPLIVLVDADIARTLGAILKDELGVGCPLLVLDGLEVGDFDYVDLGRLRLPSETVPVTVTSLAFRYDWRQEEILRKAALAAAHGHAPHSHGPDAHGPHHHAHDHHHHHVEGGHAHAGHHHHHDD